MRSSSRTLVLAVVVALVVWRTRAWTIVVPLALSAAHFAIQARLVPVPRTTVAWGETSVAVGFVLLAGALFTSYRLRPRAPARAP